MKLHFLIAVLLVSAFADDNNQCLLNTGGPGTACGTREQCALGLSCVSGLCQLVNLGSSCTADSQCGGLYPFCIGGKCDAKRIPGDPCSMNEQCISGQCSGTCVAKQLNEACGGSDCAVGLYCNPATKTCSSKIAVGGSCSSQYTAMVSNIAFAHDLTVMCADSALCDYAALSNGTIVGTCTPIFSGAQSSVCGAFGSFTCPLGSTCNGNSCGNLNSNNNNNCSPGAACSGVTTFCACNNNNNNNPVVFTVPATNTKSFKQMGASVGTGGASAGAAGTGATVNTQTVAAGVGQQGAAVGTQGATVQTGAGGATVNTQGAAVGAGQNGAGAAVGTQGATVQTGQTGVNAGTQGVSAQTGQTGVNAGTQGATVQTGQTGVIAGTQGVTVVSTGTTISTTNLQGTCRSDNCMNQFAPDYYSCLLQNGCGLASEPVLINGTCANNCAFLYSRIKCCQAGFQPIVSPAPGSNNNNNNNNNINGLQRSIALPPQIQCVQVSQPPSNIGASSVIEVGTFLVGSLLAAFFF